MALVLRIVSAIYLVFVWIVFFMAMNAPSPMDTTLPDATMKFGIFTICVGLSVPAVALFAFGQVVADIRTMRNNSRLQTEHLDAMRSYYEPERRQLVG